MHSPLTVNFCVSFRLTTTKHTQYNLEHLEHLCCQLALDEINKQYFTRYLAYAHEIILAMSYE